MEIDRLEPAFRAAVLAYERGHRGPRRLLRGRPPSPFADGVEAFVCNVCADPARHVGATVRLALDDARRHPFAAAPWEALVAFLGAAGRRATEEYLRVERWTEAHAPWCSARTRETAQDFLTPIRGATGGNDDGERLDGSMHAAELNARTALAALFTSAPSGWVREAAIEHLAAHGAVVALPYVVARLADAVPQVRAAARRALESCLSALNARALLAATPELTRARRRPHFEDETLARQVEALLRSQARTGLFLERLDDRDREVRRAAFTFALETEGTAVVGGVIRRAFDSGDPIVLTRALDALGRLGVDAAGQEEHEALLLAALTHRSRLVRRRALAACFVDGGARVTLPEALVNHALLDSTREVRSLAQRASGRTRDALVAFYRAHAGEDHSASTGGRHRSRTRGLSAAWHGLAEFGDDAALARLRAALAAPRTLDARGRVAAMRTLRLALGARAVPELVELLHEPTLAREAARGLVALGDSAPLAMLEQLAVADDQRLVRAALLLARSRPVRTTLGRYDELRVLLHAARATSPLTAAISARVAQWLRHTNGRLPRPERAVANELCALLSRAAALHAAERDELAIRLGCG